MGLCFKRLKSVSESSKYLDLRVGFEEFKGSIACGVQRFKELKGFEEFEGFKVSIACGVQRFKELKGFEEFKGSRVQLPAAFKGSKS